MENVIWIALAVFILLIPVRLASYLFKAPRQGWWPSFLVLFLGALFVSGAGILLPQAWLDDSMTRFGIVFLIFMAMSAFVLEMKAWQAALLALVICTVYSFSMTRSGVVGVSAETPAGR